MYSVNIVYKCLCNLCIFSCFFLFCLLLFSTMIGEYRCVYIEDRRRDYCCLVKPAGSEPSDARPNCANLMIVSRPSRAVRRAPVRVAITTRVDSRRTPIEACCRVYAFTVHRYLHLISTCRDTRIRSPIDKVRACGCVGAYSAPAGVTRQPAAELPIVPVADPRAANPAMAHILSVDRTCPLHSLPAGEEFGIG